MDAKGELLKDILLLARAARIVLEERVLRSVEGLSIGSSKANLLRLLRRGGNQTVNDIARFLGQTKAAASQNVDSLVRAGLVRRETDKRDRRRVAVSLTARGARLLQKIEAIQKKALAKAVQGMSDAEVRNAAKAARSLAERLVESAGARLEGSEWETGE
ncbi:MAG: MarR family winged helix-turn-helix transcriptional regulator [Planctomycetota bacterium]